MAAPGRKKGPAPKSQVKLAKRPASHAPSPGLRTPGDAEPEVAARNGLGLTGVVLGVLGVIASPTIAFGVILGVPAMVVGFLALKRVRAGGATNFRSAVAAMGLGFVSVGIAAFLIIYGQHLLNTPAGKRYSTCLDEAGKDKAARQVCEDAFDRER